MHAPDTLEALFQKFPGIGPRQAERFVYFLLRQSKSFRRELAEHIQHLDAQVVQCRTCMRFTSTPRGTVCGLCADLTRDVSQLLVVEKDADIDALEKSASYRGYYMVLGGTRTLAGGIVPAFEKALLARIADEVKKQTLTEVIVALSLTPDGEYTTADLKDKIQTAYPGLSVSVLGRGLSTGSELEYADPRTLESALKNRG